MLKYARRFLNKSRVMANRKIERDAAVGGGGVTGRESRETYVKPRLNEFGKISDLTTGGSGMDREGSGMDREGMMDRDDVTKMS